MKRSAYRGAGRAVVGRGEQGEAEEKRVDRGVGGGVVVDAARVAGCQNSGVAELAGDAEGAEGGVVVGGGVLGGGCEALDELEVVALCCEDECCFTIVVKYGEGAAWRHEVLRWHQPNSECNAVKSCPSIVTLLVELCIPHIN
jgi:hypothetical protein